MRRGRAAWVGVIRGGAWRDRSASALQQPEKPVPAASRGNLQEPMSLSRYKRRSGRLHVLLAVSRRSSLHKTPRSRQGVLGSEGISTRPPSCRERIRSAGWLRSDSFEAGLLTPAAAYSSCCRPRSRARRLISLQELTDAPSRGQRMRWSRSQEVVSRTCDLPVPAALHPSDLPKGPKDRSPSPRWKPSVAFAVSDSSSHPQRQIETKKNQDVESLQPAIPAITARPMPRCLGLLISVLFRRVGPASDPERRIMGLAVKLMIKCGVGTHQFMSWNAFGVSQPLHSIESYPKQTPPKVYEGLKEPVLGDDGRCTRSPGKLDAPLVKHVAMSAVGSRNLGHSGPSEPLPAFRSTR